MMHDLQCHVSIFWADFRKELTFPVVNLGGGGGGSNKREDDERGAQLDSSELQPAVVGRIGEGSGAVNNVRVARLRAATVVAVRRR
jgi:hypothetical protein